MTHNTIYGTQTPRDYGPQASRNYVQQHHRESTNTVSRQAPANDTDPYGYRTTTTVHDSNVQKKLTNHLHHAQFTSSGHNKTAQAPFNNQPIEAHREANSIHRGQLAARPSGYGSAKPIGMTTVNNNTYGQTSQGERLPAEARNQTTTVDSQHMSDMGTNQSHSQQPRRVGNEQSQYQRPNKPGRTPLGRGQEPNDHSRVPEDSLWTR
jgi:hypothetical protein